MSSRNFSIYPKTQNIANKSFLFYTNESLTNLLGNDYYFITNSEYGTFLVKYKNNKYKIYGKYDSDEKIKYETDYNSDYIKKHFVTYTNPIPFFENPIFILRTIRIINRRLRLRNTFRGRSPIRIRGSSPSHSRSSSHSSTNSRSSSISRSPSPSRTRASSPTRTRASSPTRTRASSPTRTVKRK